MSNPENASSETRAGAILDFCERCVRDELPELDDEETDGPFMCGCMKKLGKDMKYLTTRASAQTTNAFYNALRSADSMRVVPIDPESKDGKQLKVFHCDVCGTKEHNCRYAIDLAGIGHKPDVWFGEPNKIKGEWDTFIEEYGDRFRENEVAFFDHSEYQPTGMLKCDQGRYYVGKTCLRKSKLVFLCSTLLQETMYKMYHQVSQVDEVELKKGELLFVSDDEVQEFIDMKQELELCIANEARKTVPDIEQDDDFWDMIDYGREAEAEKTGEDIHDVIRKRTAQTLAAMADGSPRDTTEEGEDDEEERGSVMASDDGSYQDSNLYEEDDDPDVGFVVDDDEAEEVPGPRVPPRKRKSARRVIDDESEVEEEEEAPPPTTAPKPKRQKASSGPVRRSGRLSGTPAPAPEKQAPSSKAAGKRPVAPPPTAAPPPAAAGSSVADSAAARRQAFGSMPQPPQRVSRIASGLRIPGADGSPGVLGSRRAALLSLMDVQRELTAEKRDVLAAKLTRAIMTYQELMDLRAEDQGE